MKHRIHYTPPPKRVEWVENLKAVGLSVVIGVSMAAVLVYNI